MSSCRLSRKKKHPLAPTGNRNAIKKLLYYTTVKGVVTSKQTFHLWRILNGNRHLKLAHEEETVQLGTSPATRTAASIALNFNSAILVIRYSVGLKLINSCYG